MKILVFGGSGKIGSAVATDLARDPAVRQVGIAGRDARSLERVKRRIGTGNVVPHVVDVDDSNSVRAAMDGYDAGALSLPDRRTSYRVAHLAVEAGFSIVDMLEEYHRRPDASETENLQVPWGMTLEQYGDWLHEQAANSGCTFVDGMGFAPGIANVTIAEGIRKLDRAVSAVARVGGIPDKESAAKHPLRYMITWSFEHVLREYVIRLLVRKGGQTVEVEAGAEPESFRFDRLGHDETLECAITPGMPSFLYTHTELEDFCEKTVRWPGHWSGVKTLKECGLLDLAPIDFDGRNVVPREFLLALLTPRLESRPGESDVCVMYNTVRGTRDGRPVTIEHRMWEEADPESGLSAMARVTGFPVAIVARLLANGSIRKPGILAPEEAIGADLYPDFMRELAARRIRIEETVGA